MEKIALVTISIGEQGMLMGDISHPLMKAYADKIGADFIVLDTPKYKNIYGKYTYEKLNCYALLENYERILFVDSDVLISPDSPCLFTKIPAHIFAASNEEKYSKSVRDREATQKHLGEIEWKYPYFNAGVMLFSKAHRELFDPNAEKLKYWVHGEFRSEYINLLNDQPYFNYRLNELAYPFEDLTQKFNHTRVIKETSTRFRSYFIHYAGPSGHRYGSRLEQMSKDAQVLRKPLLLWLSRKILAYRWFADRLDRSFMGYLVFVKLKLFQH